MDRPPLQRQDTASLLIGTLNNWYKSNSQTQPYKKRYSGRLRKVGYCYITRNGSLWLRMHINFIIVAFHNETRFINGVFWFENYSLNCFHSIYRFYSVIDDFLKTVLWHILFLKITTFLFCFYNWNNPFRVGSL